MSGKREHLLNGVLLKILITSEKSNYIGIKGKEN